MSKRETAINALFAVIDSLKTSTLKVYRNEEKTTKVDPDGTIKFWDGDSPDPEVLLSPVRYIYEHLVEVQVFYQDQDETIRRTKLDALLVSIGNLIRVDQTLGGNADYVEPFAPEISNEQISGGETIAVASFNILVQFSTSNPLT